MQSSFLKTMEINYFIGKQGEICRENKTAVISVNNMNRCQKIQILNYCCSL